MKSVKTEDIGIHEMHIGFSAEESQRSFSSKHPMYINKYPLIEMGMMMFDMNRKFVYTKVKVLNSRNNA